MARLEIRSSDGGGKAVCVILSRRNLLSLLAKLDIAGSFRTILNNDCWLDGERTEDVFLVLHAEEDEPHYSRRADPPGPMTPETEKFVRAHGGWSRTDG